MVRFIYCKKDFQRICRRSNPSSASATLQRCRSTSGRNIAGPVFMVQCLPQASITPQARPAVTTKPHSEMHSQKHRAFARFRYTEQHFIAVRPKELCLAEP